MSGRVASLTASPSRAGSREASIAVRTTVFLLVPVAMLLVVGLGAILSSSSVFALSQTGDHLFYFKRQVLWASIGVGALLMTARIPYRWYRRAAGPLLVIAIVGLFAVLLLGEVRGGAQRWIALGPVTVQPSEFAKFAIVVFLAAAMSRKADHLHGFAHFAWPVAGSLGVVGVLVMAQPDLGTTLIIAIGALAVLTASAAPLRFVFGAGAMGAAMALALAAASPYRWARIRSFLDPLGDPLGNGYQVSQSLVALGTGGWFGIGLGASRARWFFLPNAHTDFIFAIIGEETGLAGALVVVALFVVLAVAGTVVSLRAPDPFGRMLGLGIVTWLSAQALINVGGVTGLLPITGVTLPFVSFGGTSLIMNLAAVGVLINLARSGEGAAER